MDNPFTPELDADYAERDGIQRFDLEAIVYALEFTTECDALDDFVLDTVPMYYPGHLVELHERLAAHDDPEIRTYAASGITSIMEVDEEAGLRIAAQLLGDEDEDVVSHVHETLKWATEEAEGFPAETLAKFTALCRDDVTSA